MKKLAMMITTGIMGGAASSLLTGLVSYWKMDEESGVRVDVIAGHNATDPTTALYATGLQGNGALLDIGSAQYLEVADHADLRSGDIDFTWDGFINLQQVADNQVVLARTNEFFIYLSASNPTAVYLRYWTIAGTQKNVNSVYFLYKPQWAYFALCHDSVNNKIILQIDNVIAEFAETGGVRGLTSSTLFGKQAAGNPCDGVLDEYSRWSRVLTADERNARYKGGIGSTYPFNDVVSPYTRLTVLGDSISDGIPAYEWPNRLINAYQTIMTLNNHAASSQSVIGHMDAQTSASASDNANFIIIALGANDNNAGDMGVLQAECEENISELKASNPNATIYWMNVLPVWTDITGATPIDKSNVRAAIAAACTAQSIACWDTFTDPWITAADTLDGFHPHTGGHQKIVARMVALLPTA